MRSLPKAATLVPVVIFLACGGRPTAQETAAWEDAPKKPEYVRLIRDPQKTPIAMETAVVQFAPRDCSRDVPTVDLVAAVHIGDKAYYERLNKLFESYDAVLYELVAPKDSKPTAKEGKPTNVLSAIQVKLKDLLELDFQLFRIRYDVKNMVHADLSPEEFAKSMQDRGESVFDLFIRLLVHAMTKETTPSDGMNEMQLLLGLFSKDRAVILKRVMAEEMQEMEGMVAVIEGPKGSTIIGERNKAALAVLGEQIKAGKKKIAIFYGAAHLPDMERRLGEDFDLVPIKVRWLTAWNMRTPPKTAAAKAAKTNAKPAAKP